ncbi:MAG: AIR synthase-related protein, partial [Promethearchaeota archaeon]
ALNDWSNKSNIGILIDEEKVPMKKQVHAICEMLGLDPFAIASEGRVLMSVNSTKAEEILKKIRSTEIGKEAVIIGEVSSNYQKKVLLKTLVGGTRFVDMPIGENIPRIC